MTTLNKIIGGGIVSGDSTKTKYMNDDYEASDIMKEGKKSEAYIADLLRRYPDSFSDLGSIKYVGQYDDWNNPTHRNKQKHGIDMETASWIDNKMIIVKIDVKEETYLGVNGNILLEWWIMDHGRKIPGWGQTGEADYIIWDCVNANCIIITNKKEFLKQKDLYLSDNPGAELRKANTKGTGGQKYTLNWIMPYDPYGEACSKKYMKEG